MIKLLGVNIIQQIAFTEFPIFTSLLHLYIFHTFNWNFFLHADYLTPAKFSRNEYKFPN